MTTTQKILKILMLEDSPDDVLIIERVLRKGKISFEKLNVDKRDEYRDALRKFKPDIILSDHALPGFNSLEALKICRTELGDTPFILVSGTASDEFAASCIREGADDYISKSDLRNLTSLIRAALKKRKLERDKRESINTIRREFRELKIINEALDNFVFTVSHNLRGPVVTLMGLMNVARETNDLAAIRSLHDMMHASLSKLDNTLTGLVAHAQNANKPLESDVINWEDLIHAIFSRLDAFDPKSDITRFIHLEADTPFYSDPERVTMILGNVIHNTYVHRNKASGHESITSVEVFTNAECAVIVVKDNGTGISPNILAKVYDMFFRGSSASHGAGLGLYLVKQGVEKLQGSIDIVSHENIGTTVRIELPQKQKGDASPGDIL